MRSFSGLGQLAAGTSLAFFCLGLAGCSTTKATRTPGDAGLVHSNYLLADALYLLAAPHPRLYVEVDAVEGYEPSEGTLRAHLNFWQPQEVGFGRYGP